MCRSRAELLRLGRLIPFNVFFFFSSSPLIQELLVLTCRVPDSATKDIKHMHTCHPHSLSLTHTHSDVDSFVIYRQYLRDDKDNSVCAFARFQSKQLSVKLIQ